VAATDPVRQQPRADPADESRWPRGVGSWVGLAVGFVLAVLFGWLGVRQYKKVVA
jgi:high-affinity Fe2+/Pb2+ permease